MSTTAHAKGTPTTKIESSAVSAIERRNEASDKLQVETLPTTDTQRRNLLRGELFLKLYSHMNTKTYERAHLFLQLDYDKSGRISPRKFIFWSESVEIKLSIEDCKHVQGKRWDNHGMRMRDFVAFLHDLETENQIILKQNNGEQKNLEEDTPFVSHDYDLKKETKKSSEKYTGSIQ